VQEQEFDENISITLESDTSTESEQEPEQLPESELAESEPKHETEQETEQKTESESEAEPEIEQEVEQEAEQEPESATEYNGLSVKVDKIDQPYEYGDYVTITGSGATKSSKITIEIIPPDGSCSDSVEVLLSSVMELSSSNSCTSANDSLSEVIPNPKIKNKILE